MKQINEQYFIDDGLYEYYENKFKKIQALQNYNDELWNKTKYELKMLMYNMIN